MSADVPQHQTNDATFLAPGGLEQVECQAGALAPATPAKPRPTGRPRIFPSAEELPADVVEWIDCIAVPAPPGTKARPRPQGRERDRAEAGNGPAVDPAAGEQAKDASK